MASPEQFIEINDFSPGIWSDATGTNAPDYTAANASSAIPFVNGMAHPDGTARCRADRSGALIPLPMPARPDSNIMPIPFPVVGQFLDPSPAPITYDGVYVLDAQVVPAPIGGAVGPTKFHPADARLLILWGMWWDHNLDGNANAYIVGREYSLTNVANAQDFMRLRSVDTAPATGLDGINTRVLPPGSLCAGRFYYGATTPGITEAAGDTSFRSRWWFPVGVAVGATSDPLENGLDFRKLSTGAISANERSFERFYTAGQVHTNWSPAIGGAGQGPASIAMRFNNNNTANLPLPAATWRWYYHYNDFDHRFNGSPDEAMNNPYMIVSHQGRIVFADRRRTALMYDDLASVDDMLYYSDYGLPCQDPIAPINTYTYPTGGGGGQANTGYAEYPAKTQTAYNKLAVADDVFGEIGTLGVVTVDQLLVVKSEGGGVLISGDLDNPSIRRLPYIESTHGLRMKGAQTPIGFVYGSPNGIFVWAGGEETRKLSRQLDGFFWNHTRGDQVFQNPYLTVERERMAGSRGRFAFWNGLICVPNNYVYDVETDSWWRLEVDPTFRVAAPFEGQQADGFPFNVYEVDPFNRLMAFGYKNRGEIEGSVAFHRYQSEVLDSHYSWKSHPLVETRGRTLSFQNISMVATAQTGSVATIEVTLEGFDVNGAALGSDVVTLTLAAQPRPQLLRADITPNFNAEYVTVKLVANSNNSAIAAPKIHNLKLGVADRATTRRHG